jgi:membrane protein YqaA with SNARE-associated domain
MKILLDECVPWPMHRFLAGRLVFARAAKRAANIRWSRIMMAVESSLFPLPSEIVIPPAAHLAATHQVIGLSLWGIVLAGTLGSWFGATLMYWASRLAGRPLVLHFGKYFFISTYKVEGAERWAAHYGAMGIFISRFAPGRLCVEIPLCLRLKPSAKNWASCRTNRAST